MSEHSKVTRELARKSAPFKTRAELATKCPSDHGRALEPAVSGIVRAHGTPSTNFLTKDYILSLASEFETMRDFRRENPSAYSTACRLRILPDLHQILRLSRESWDDEKLVKSAASYGSMQEVLHNDTRLYHALNRKLKVDPEFLERAGVVMQPTYDRGFTSCAYVYTFDDGTQYVGYSSSKEQRHLQHANGHGKQKTASPVFRYAMNRPASSQAADPR
jgi:hypothetical protein